TGAKLITTFHATERVRHGGHLPLGEAGTVHAVETWLAMRSHGLIASSVFMVHEVAAGLEMTGDSIRQIPNGIQPEWWAGDDSDQRGPHVLAWGRIQYEKGFQVLARAIAELRGRVE